MSKKRVWVGWGGRKKDFKRYIQKCGKEWHYVCLGIQHFKNEVTKRIDEK
jgi:hypothetical protein